MGLNPFKRKQSMNPQQSSGVMPAAPSTGSMSDSYNQMTTHDAVAGNMIQDVMPGAAAPANQEVFTVPAPIQPMSAPAPAPQLVAEAASPVTMPPAVAPEPVSENGTMASDAPSAPEMISEHGAGSLTQPSPEAVSENGAQTPGQTISLAAHDAPKPADGTPDSAPSAVPGSGISAAAHEAVASPELPHAAAADAKLEATAAVIPADHVGAAAAGTLPSDNLVNPVSGSDASTSAMNPPNFETAERKSEDMMSGAVAPEPVVPVDASPLPPHALSAADAKTDAAPAIPADQVGAVSAGLPPAPASPPPEMAAADVRLDAAPVIPADQVGAAAAGTAPTVTPPITLPPSTPSDTPATGVASLNPSGVADTTASNVHTPGAQIE